MLAFSVEHSPPLPGGVPRVRHQTLWCTSVFFCIAIAFILVVLLVRSFRSEFQPIKQIASWDVLPSFASPEQVRNSDWGTYITSLYAIDDPVIWDKITDASGVLDLNTFWVFYRNSLPESMASLADVFPRLPAKMGDMFTHYDTHLDQRSDLLYRYQYTRTAETARRAGETPVLPFVPPTSGIWVEVMHGYNSLLADPTDTQTFWWFMMKGSGVWLNVGRTAVLPWHGEWARLEGACANGWREKCASLGDTKQGFNCGYEEFGQCNRKDASGYDTLQFHSHPDQGTYKWEVLSTKHFHTSPTRKSCPAFWETTNNPYKPPLRVPWASIPNLLAQFTEAPYTCHCNETMAANITNCQKRRIEQ